jgi:GNAT superfamily N-acetyltransferase
MNSEFLGKHLDKSGNEVCVWFSNSTPSSPVLSLLFKTYSQLLESNLVTQKFYWNRLADSCVVWAEDTDKNVLSGIVFEFEQQWKAGLILTTFTDPDCRNRGINKICFRHYLEKSKEHGMVRTLGLASLHNDSVVKKNSAGNDVSWGGGKPWFLIFTDKV